MPMRHQSDDAMDNNERTSKSSSTSEHIIDGARDRLRSSICSVRDSITNSEHSFLHWLLSNGLESDIQFAAQLLHDQDLFPQPPPASDCRMIKDEGPIEDDFPQDAVYNRQSSSCLSEAFSSGFAVIPESLSEEEFKKPKYVSDRASSSLLHIDELQLQDITVNNHQGFTRSVSESKANTPTCQRSSLPAPSFSAPKLKRTKSLPSMHIIDFVKREKHLNRRRKSLKLSRVGLWKAHQDGVAPSELKRRSTLNSKGGLNELPLLPEANEALHDDEDPFLVFIENEDANLTVDNKNKQHEKNLSLSCQEITFISNDPGKSIPPISITKTKIESPQSSTSAQENFSYDITQRWASSGAQGIELEIGLTKELEIALKHPESLHRSIDTDADSWSQDSVYDDDSLDSSSFSENDITVHDAWNVLKDEYCLACGYGGDSLPFQILGTSADDINANPHVLSPPLMESLQAFLPNLVANQNFWMKYSLLRDGADHYKLLQKIRGACNTILAIETTRGRVFGSYTTSPWRKNRTYFGNGESFLWRMKQSRLTPCSSILDQAVLESELEVFPATDANDYYQLCLSNMIAVGGGEIDGCEIESSYHSESMRSIGDDFGLCIDGDLLSGSSSPCATFNNNCLSNRKVSDGSDIFQIANLEVWTLTPCSNVDEAEKLEMGLMFLQKHSNT